MKNCKFDGLIDDYLLGKLNEKKREKFEEHYFNCEQCFQKAVARDELIAVIKNKGHVIFADERSREERKEAFFVEKIFAFLTPKQWAYAAVSMVVLLFLCLLAVPIFEKTAPPQFFLDGEDIARGVSICLISPVIDIESVPSQFKWVKLENDYEYKIYIYNDELLWSSSTKENAISLPEEVKEEIKNEMKANQKYSWQVKAFSPEGTLIAVSPRVQFTISAK
jgi:hypothetical protein